MVLLLFLLVFIAVPVVELWLILQIGSMIGAGPTILLLLADSLLGAWLMRSQGSAVWQRFSAAASAGRVPAREALDGFLVILGGTLLLLPGFLSDLAGLFLVLPPTRRVARGGLTAFVARRARVAFFMGGPANEDARVRDFKHSDQPRRGTSSTQGRREPQFDFETQQIRE
jgi:UPF0716 protein FxsA